MNKAGNQKPVVTSSESASGKDLHSSSLLPMLLAGLALVTVGGIVIMMFV
jgi:hypothetical protein